MLPSFFQTCAIITVSIIIRALMLMVNLLYKGHRLQTIPRKDSLFVSSLRLHHNLIEWFILSHIFVCCLFACVVARWRTNGWLKPLTLNSYILCQAPIKHTTFILVERLTKFYLSMKIQNLTKHSPVVGKNNKIIGVMVKLTVSLSYTLTTVESVQTDDHCMLFICICKIEFKYL